MVGFLVALVAAVLAAVFWFQAQSASSAVKGLKAGAIAEAAHLRAELERAQARSREIVAAPPPPAPVAAPAVDESRQREAESRRNEAERRARELETALKEAREKERAAREEVRRAR